MQLGVCHQRLLGWGLGAQIQDMGKVAFREQASGRYEIWGRGVSGMADGGTARGAEF